MGRPKKAIAISTNNEIIGNVEILEESIEKIGEKTTIEPYYVRVMDGDTIKVIDANKEKNWMLKYKHASGSNFHF